MKVFDLKLRLPLVYAGFFLSVSLLGLIAWQSHLSTLRVRQATNARAQARQNILTLETLLSSLKDAETGQRGFLLTGRESYLGPYNEAVGRLVQESAAVAALGVGDTRELTETIRHKVQELHETIELRRRLGLGAALRLVLTDQGNTDMVKIRGILNDLEAKQYQLLAERENYSKVIIQQSSRTLALGMFFSILIVCLASFFALRGEAARDRAEAHLREREQIATEASRAKSVFLANMSHEIRTPINGISGMSSLLLETPLNASQKEAVLTVQQSSENLLALVTDILDFSRIESGKLELESRPFIPATLVSELVRSFVLEAEEKNLRISAAVGKELEQSCLGDVKRLRQVLVNLVGNALKFTAQGSVEIRAEAFESARAQHLGLRFEISDTGMGIDDARLEKLFAPFTQGDSRSDRRFGGTGLGLSIAQALVKRMGGEIGARSRPGQGSTFWLSLELPLAPEVPARPSLSRRTARILLAEDNLVNQKVALKMLERLGHQARAVSNGREALKALAAEPFDLILMDCQMPELDGYEATRQIRELKAAPYRAIPIVAMTASSVEGDRERCLAAGMNDYLAKPVPLARLEEILDRLVGVKT